MRKSSDCGASGVILFSSLVLAGCQTSATAPESRHVSQGDLDFITGLTNLVEFDHRVIGSELERTSDPRVQTLAVDLLTRIDAFDKKVQPAEARDGISPPANVTLFEQSDMHSRVATLMATSKYDFDQEFLSDELAGNEEVLEQANEVLREPVGDPRLHSLAMEARTRLRQDVARLNSLQAQIKS